jgi:hypothetical protein
VTIIIYFRDGGVQERELEYPAFREMFRSASLDGHPIESIEVVSKDSNKGPNRIKFE